MRLSKWVGGILIFAAFIIAGKVNGNNSDIQSAQNQIQTQLIEF